MEFCQGKPVNYIILYLEELKGINLLSWNKLEQHLIYINILLTKCYTVHL